MRCALLIALLSFAACGPLSEEASPARETALGSTEQTLCAPASQPNLLQNPSFDTVGPIGSPTTIITQVPGGAGYSAAASWTLFTNNPGYLYTRLLPTARPNGGSSNMIQVVTDQPNNGLVQVFGPLNTGPTRTSSGAWVYVLRGQVGIGTGNGGNTGHDVYSTTIAQWEYLEAPNGVSPANEFIIYATSPGGAEFFVDDASVVESPNLLQNPDFDTVGPNGSPVYTSVSVPGGAGYSAAASWTLFANTAPARFATELVPSTRVQGARMIHVITTGKRNGLVQVFRSRSECQPEHTESGAWVYVRSGRVGIGTGDGGNTGIDAESTTLNQWEWLQAPNGVSPANEFIIYATTEGGADFDVDFARVNELP